MSPWTTLGEAAGKALAPERLRSLDRDLAADKRFFRRFNQRTYRIRACFPSEVAEWETATGRGVGPEDLGRMYVVVRKLTAHLRMRQFIFTYEPIDTALNDEECQAIFAHVSQSGGGFPEDIARKVLAHVAQTS